MQAQKSKAELQLYKAKLANSYNELLEQFSAKDLTHVGNYTVGKLIGKGSFGKVYLARHDLTNGTKVVLKASSKEDTNLAREIHHHRQFIHPHIARLYEVIVTENQVWLVLEYCPGDELYTYLCDKGPLPVAGAQKIFTQLVGAVAYIHSKSCVHRDLKLENVLLDKQDNVKLVDFGFTREYEGKANYLQTFCGTVCYSAPEMLRGEKYAGEKVDVWSLGIILYALLKGELPFDEDDDAATKMKILKDEPTYPDTFPTTAKTLISKMLSKRPFPRPTLAEILSDPFLIDHASQQQAILKVAQPAPFTTPLEKTTLERMKSAGVEIDKVIENVLSQRCDALAGWWALLIEKEARKEARRERKRKEREADLKLLRRLSGASGRFSTVGLLAQVDEEGSKNANHINKERPRSSSRGRAQRRSTPQIMVTDLPQLPEGSAMESPVQTAGQSTPPPPKPVDKDSLRSRSGSRPPPLVPPKERQRRRSSTLQLVATNPDLLAPQAILVNGVNKRRNGKRKNNQFLMQMEKFKSWFVESTKRAKSPGKTNSTASENSKEGSKASSRPLTAVKETSPLAKEKQQRPEHDRMSSTTSSIHQSRNSYGATLTPVTSSGMNTRLDTTVTSRTQGQARHRDSLSPSPITPRSSIYRRSSGGVGLRGRKSTSSSVSSVRSLPRHKTHSKASSQSSNSLDTIHSPGTRSAGRSPHTSIKVLPATPTTSSFGKFVRNSQSSTNADNSSAPTSKFNESAIPLAGGIGALGGGGVMFAKRGKKAFKGPMLNSGLFGDRSSGMGSPAVGMPRAGSDGKMNLGLRDLVGRKRGDAGDGGNPAHRKSLILEEEEEEQEEEEEHDTAGQEGGAPMSATTKHLAKHDSQAILEEDEDEDLDNDDEEEADYGMLHEADIEEVDEFSDVETNLARGERVHSIVFYDDHSPDLKGLNISTDALDQHHVQHPNRDEKEVIPRQESGQVSPGTVTPAVKHGDMDATARMQTSATMEGRWDEGVDSL